MELSNIFSLFGGLALFLYGMSMMSTGLELAAGNKMKTILEKLTTNRFLGVIVGALITALIQSSSATTVMVVGFVNSGLMKLENAVWVIMGANIGTTITGQLIALNVTEYAPIMAFLGVAIIIFLKNDKVKAYGTIFAGLGLLFMGMDMMSASMKPLRTMPEFVNLMTKFENPILGILVGAGFTALIQSSSASVGILQALAMSGVMTLSSSLYVLFGQNIGTCITSVLASIGTNKNAKRTTILHLVFNIIGTVVFVAVSLVLPFASFVESLSPGNVATQIANTHTIFNVVTTIILLPFGKKLVDLSYKILPDKGDEDAHMKLKYLDFSSFDKEYHVGTGAIMCTQAYNEIQNMLNVARDNLHNSFNLLVEFDKDKYEKILENEEYINYLNSNINRFTTHLIHAELATENSDSVGRFIRVATDIERIGDHAINIANKAKELNEQGISFSGSAIKEVKIMDQLTMSVLDELRVINHNDLVHIVEKVDVIEDNIDKTYNQFSANHLDRLKDKTCVPEHSVAFTKILTDFERIGDHSLNIAQHFGKLLDDLSVLKMIKE